MNSSEERRFEGAFTPGWSYFSVMTLCGACLEGLASREHRTESHMMGSVS